MFFVNLAFNIGFDTVFPLFSDSEYQIHALFGRLFSFIKKKSTFHVPKFECFINKIVQYQIWGAENYQGQCTKGTIIKLV